MKKLDDLISKLKSFESGIYPTIKKVVEEYDYIILDMNSESQLFEQGINREGEYLADYAGGYSPVTIQIKMLKNQPTDRVTLRDEGDFHSSFYIEFHPDGFEIKAKDWKSEMLQRQWGDILGLTDENLKEFARDYVRPELVKYFETLKQL